MAAFYAMTGEDIFSASKSSASEHSHDAQRILHTLRTTAWGAEAFGFSNTLVDDAINANMISLEEGIFERKFNSGQAIIRHIFSFPEAELITSNDTEFDYELFYEACLLSWQFLLKRDDDLIAESLDKYAEARQRIWERDGTNSATQRDHFRCLEENAGNFGSSCGQSIAVPQFCPVFQFLED